MNAPLKRYPSYKLSGVPWLGEVPDHWEVWRLKGGVANVIDQRSNHSPNEIYIALEHVESWTGRIRRVSESHIDGQVKRFRKGDVLFGKLRPYLAKVTRPDCYGVCVGEFLVFRPRSNDLDSAYLEPVLRSKPFVEAVNTSTFGAKMPRAEWSFIGNMNLPVPPAREQIAIVRYLNQVEQRIRHYIVAKEKLISLLEEQNQIIIHQAVTGQIDVRTGKPYPAYKPSGVEWLGDVPEHWEVRRLKTLCSMKSGDGITAMSIDPEGKYPVYGGNGLRGFTSKYTHCGDFALIGRQGALCGNVHIARGQFYASEHAVVATLNPGYVLEWFVPVLGEMDLNRYSIAAAQPGLAVERILNLSLPVPPSGEQASIATFIERQSDGIDNSISNLRRQIELIREYRTRLIADVVTGKMDVRGIVDELPDTDSIANPDVDGTVHDGPGIRGENQRHVRTQDQIKEVPT